MNYLKFLIVGLLVVATGMAYDDEPGVQPGADDQTEKLHYIFSDLRGDSRGQRQSAESASGPFAEQPASVLSLMNVNTAPSANSSAPNDGFQD